DIEFPDQLSRGSVERTQPSVALWDDDLRFLACLNHQRAGPLTHDDVRAGRIVLPDNLAIALPQANDARSLRLGNSYVAFIHTVASNDVNQVSIRGDRTKPAHGHLRAAREYAQLLDHVELPDLSRLRLATLERPDIKADDFSP